MIVPKGYPFGEPRDFFYLVKPLRQIQDGVLFDPMCSKNPTGLE